MLVFLIPDLSAINLCDIEMPLLIITIYIILDVQLQFFFKILLYIRYTCNPRMYLGKSGNKCKTKACTHRKNNTCTHGHIRFILKAVLSKSMPEESLMINLVLINLQ